MGSEIFILVKKWSQDPLFVVTRFLSISSTSSGNSTGHVFHLFKLKFSVVTSCLLLSQEKRKKEKEKVEVSPKNNDNPKKEKKRDQRETISRGAHREGQIELC